MAVQKQDDQHEHTFSSYVRIRDDVLKTYLGRWTIGRSGESGSGISVLPAWYDDDDMYAAIQHSFIHWENQRKTEMLILPILFAYIVVHKMKLEYLTLLTCGYNATQSKSNPIGISYQCMIFSVKNYEPTNFLENRDN